MEKREMKNVAVLFCILMTFSVTLNVKAQDGNMKKIEGVADQELIQQLASSDEKVATKGAAEIFKQGERILPGLLGLKGDKRFFYGALVPNPSFSTEFRAPSGDAVINAQLLKAGKLVTVEVAAIYLINAIYFDSMQIAGSPYLTDLALVPRDRRAANTEEVVAKAWKGIGIWTESLKANGLNRLRAEKEGPLDKGNVDFW